MDKARLHGQWPRGAEPRKAATIAPGGEVIARIADELGMCATFLSRVSRRGDGTEIIYVSAYRLGASCQRKQLGRLDELVAKSEDELRQAMRAAFAQPGAKKEQRK